jgi:hypothetical protein
MSKEELIPHEREMIDEAVLDHEDFNERGLRGEQNVDPRNRTIQLKLNNLPALRGRGQMPGPYPGWTNASVAVGNYPRPQYMVGM